MTKLSDIASKKNLTTDPTPSSSTMSLSTLALSSHPVGIPLSQPHLPHQVHPGVSTSSSVVWPESPWSVNTPPPITVESELLGCTSTPQAIGPLPFIQCAAPLASTAQVNIQAVPYPTPPQFLSPSQPYALHSPPLMGFPTAVSAHTTAAALSQPFWVTFATPRISRCQGCLGMGLHHWT